jgi:hypothetical protein
MSRFIIHISMAFITVFVGVFWAARGFPMRPPRKRRTAAGDGHHYVR